MFRQIRTFGARKLRFQITRIKSPNQRRVLRELKAALVTNLLVQVPLVAAADIHSQVFLCIAIQNTS